ncbi:MAG: nuclease A inhibitor family protein [Pyrinomonadaceae bacterium]|nr:nuclease A inhibitor family protein [Acidobacteriota bacterium]MBK7932839.1 nuclease A inhibitor family protein [Acidobacteriota bacterium]MBP7415292.1 nuclease A inhibitor family protein [Pyrinomonadaceae bacterium]
MKQTLKGLTKDLIYISETDAEIVPFVLGKAERVTAEDVIKQTGGPPNEPVAVVDTEAFFARLTAISDWFGPQETRQADRFKALKEYLDEELKDIKVFKVGKIRISIYVVGIDRQGRLSGVKTTAVET